MTNTEYLNTKIEGENVTHGGAAGIIIGVCLLPFMCICFSARPPTRLLRAQHSRRSQERR